MNESSEGKYQQDGNEKPLQWRFPREFNEEIFQEVLRRNHEQELKNRGPNPDYFSLIDHDLAD